MQAKNLIAALIVSLTAGAAMAQAQDSTGTFFDFTAAKVATSTKSRDDIKAEALAYKRANPPLRDKYTYPNVGQEFTPSLTRIEVKTAARQPEGISSVAQNEFIDSTQLARAVKPAAAETLQAAAK